MRKNNMVEYKFVLANIQSLVCDSRNHLRYIDDFDSLIEDIFGIRHLARNINESWDNRDVISAIDKVGVSYLVDIFNSRQTFDIMADLVAVAYRLRDLQKQLRKQSKKSGRRNKRDMKEAKYLKKLYTDSVRYLRRRLGINDSRNMYKRKYRNLESLRDGDEFGFDEGFSSLLDDDWDDFDDFDEGSAFDEFRRRLSGPTLNRPSNGRQAGVGFNIDEEDDELDPGMDAELYDRVNRLTDIVSNLSSTIQTMTAKDQYEKAALRRRNNSQVTNPLQVYRPSQLASQMPTQNLSELQQETDYLKAQMEQLADGQREITNFLREIMSDDTADPEYDDDDDLGGFSRQEILDRYNQQQDPYQVGAEERLRREDVIDIINQQQPQPTQSTTTTTQVKPTPVPSK